MELSPRRLLRFVSLAVFLSALLPAPAWAYLDPGAGSMFIQGAIAALAAAGYAIRVHWSRIRGWFGARTHREDLGDPRHDGS